MAIGRGIRVIPVLDLMGGVIVRGVAGRRAEYQPVQSQIAASPSPRDVATALVRLEFSEAYLADLDAIAGQAPAWDVYDAVCSAGLRLWIDAGTADADAARRLIAFDASSTVIQRVVVGLESVRDEAELQNCMDVIGPERAVFSLDLNRGEPVTQVSAWCSTSALGIARHAVECGFRSMIVLDVARVGVGEGVGTLALCRMLRDEFPEIEIISGGGVRGVKDLSELAAAGCDAALVASALHEGLLGQ